MFRALFIKLASAKDLNTYEETNKRKIRRLINLIFFVSFFLIVFKKSYNNLKMSFI